MIDSIRFRSMHTLRKVEQAKHGTKPPYGGVAGLAASCALFAALAGLTGPVVAAIAAAAYTANIAIYGAYILNAASRAANGGGYLRMRYSVPGAPLAFYDDYNAVYRRP
jgi:hypothetical protein